MIETECGRAATGRMLMFHGTGRALELRRCSLPAPAEGETLVRVACCTICGSDVHSYEGRRSTPCPTILGHEILGRVERLPPGPPVCDYHGQPLRIGDRVTWSVAVHCGDCFFCRHGLPQKCLRLFKYGHQGVTDGHAFNGGLAEYCHLKRGTAILRVPEELPDVVACPANCATATCAAALRYAGNCADSVVLVQGAGALGLTMAAMCAWAGAREVIVSDRMPQRLQAALQFGATNAVLVEEGNQELSEWILNTTDGRGADVAFDMTGNPAAMESGIDLLRVGGRYVWVGAVFPSRPIAISPEIIVRKLLNIQGVHNYTPDDLQAALEFLRQTHRRFPFANMVSQVCRLEEADGLFIKAAQVGVLRTAVQPTG
jgi:putative phosphonate catabolism associated alcohol dehydrogenase